MTARVGVWGGVGWGVEFSNESPMQYITHLAFIHSATPLVVQGQFHFI